MPDYGQLEINVTSSIGLIPIKDAKISISITRDSNERPNMPPANLTNSVFEQLTTNESGRSQQIDLPAPPIEYSLEPSEVRPYSEYDLLIEAPGYEPTSISGTEILADTEALQPVTMTPLETAKSAEDVITIGDHTLYGDYPPKIPEDEIKPMDESGEIVLSRVVIPEYVVVHAGLPNDASAPNYYVRYKDYIKNVVSSEIYATWPENTIYANTLAILSFTMNRVYTEWYRNKGYDFTITNSTAYDQKWIYGRNIYSNVDLVVDNIFANYLSRPGVRQPIFTPYCDGNRVTCDGLSQWGSKYLGEEGYTPIEIIRYYYGNDMFINTSEYISGVPASWPGYNLSIGATGSKVSQVQTQLNRIAQNYPALPVISTDGVYGPATANAVSTFQRIFNLPQTGVIDYATWYEISNIFVGVSRIAEPIY
ncbi:MAG: peptidoglycan-binding protein [Lachnospiraceae bacterium]|nr:peptidoglycan-binding protein [Lachnospiraceae bacterium]